MQDEFLAEAQELFGADFDIADLNKVNTMGLYDDEDEDDEDYDEDEMDEDDADFVEGTVDPNSYTDIESLKI